MIKELEYIIGKTVKKIISGNDDVMFIFTDGSTFTMNHEQDVCLEDVNGDLTCLLNSPILMAEVVTKDDWTFVKFATKNGYVTFRWCEDPHLKYLFWKKMAGN